MTTKTRTSRLLQKDRVLHVLEDRGDAGITWLDFAVEPPDGGTPVAHLAGVVRQLRDDGHTIRTVPVRSSTGAIYGRYVLADEPGDRGWSL